MQGAGSDPAPAAEAVSGGSEDPEGQESGEGPESTEDELKVALPEVARLLEATAEGTFAWYQVRAEEGTLVFEIAADGLGFVTDTPELWQAGDWEGWDTSMDGFSRMSRYALDLCESTGNGGTHVTMHVVDDRDHDRLLATLLDGRLVFSCVDRYRE